MRERQIREGREEGMDSGRGRGVISREFVLGWSAGQCLPSLTVSEGSGRRVRGRCKGMGTILAPLRLSCMKAI